MRLLKIAAFAGVCAGLFVAGFMVMANLVSDPTVYQAEERLLLVQHSEDRKHLSKEWTIANSWGSCTHGERGLVSIPLQSKPLSDVDLSFRAKLTNPRLAKQKLIVRMNNVDLGVLIFSSKGRLLLRNFTIPMNVALRKNPMQMELVTASHLAATKPRKPRDGEWGICLTSIAISYQPSEILED